MYVLHYIGPLLCVYIEHVYICCKLIANLTMQFIQCSLTHCTERCLVQKHCVDILQTFPKPVIQFLNWLAHFQLYKAKWSRLETRPNGLKAG